MNNKGTEYERGGAGKDMDPKLVELEKRRNRALKALQIALECGDDPTVGVESLEMARSAYASFLGGYGPSKGRFSRLKNLASFAAIAAMAICIYEAGERGVGFGAQAYNGPPFVWGSARLVNDVVREGDNLEIIASHKYLKACDWSVTRDWYQDRKLIATTTISLPAIPVSREFSTRKWVVELPDQLEPGNYDFKATLKAICDDQVWQQEVFEQNFQLLPKRVDPKHNT